MDNDDDPQPTKMPKVKAPDTFDSNWKELKKFLMQCDIYFQLREADFESETNKVLFAIGLLRGSAAEWVEPTVKDYLDNTVAQQQM